MLIKILPDTTVSIYLFTAKSLHMFRVSHHPSSGVPIRSCWREVASDGRRITAAEMKYMRRTAGYTCTDYRTNAQIAKELKSNTNFGQITGIQEKLDTTCK